MKFLSIFVLHIFLIHKCYSFELSNLIQKTQPQASQAGGQVNANGQTLTYVYDSLNRLITKTTPEQKYAFTYDSLGRLTSAVNNSSNLTFWYDAIGELIQTSFSLQPSAFSLSYSYDPAGREASMTGKGVESFVV